MPELRAFSAAELVDKIEEAELGPDLPDAVVREAAERLITLANQHTTARGDGGLNQEKDYIICTNWDNFCRDTFGSSQFPEGDVPNRFALATVDFEVSKGRKAWLCKNAVAVQQGWLETGDSRKTQMKEIDQTDGDFLDKVGQFWSPREYTLLIELGDDLVKDETSLEDAM